MLISYKHNFIFIHNYKVAGTSITTALKPFGLKNPPLNYALASKIELIPQSYYINEAIRRIVPSFKSHTKSSEAKKQLPTDFWNEAFKFGFVRNPWSWQVSLYHYMCQNKKHFQYELANNFKNFNEYIHWRVEKEVRLQKSFFIDSDGKVIVDYIGKIENIKDEFFKICGKIGINGKLPHKNKSKHKSYRDYYSDKTSKMVADAFKDDIKMFDYEF